jgi:hypothetical protein
MRLGLMMTGALRGAESQFEISDNGDICPLLLNMLLSGQKITEGDLGHLLEEQKRYSVVLTPDLIKALLSMRDQKKEL